MDKSVTDLTCNGVCSQCGNCCTNMLPLTEKEFKQLKSIVKRTKMKPHTFNNVLMVTPAIDMTCPFLDNNNKCRIYNERPTVCRSFICSEGDMSVLNKMSFEELARLQIHNIREEIFK